LKIDGIASANNAETISLAISPTSPWGHYYSDDDGDIGWSVNAGDGFKLDYSSGTMPKPEQRLH